MADRQINLKVQAQTAKAQADIKKLQAQLNKLSKTNLGAVATFYVPHFGWQDGGWTPLLLLGQIEELCERKGLCDNLRPLKNWRH